MRLLCFLTLIFLNFPLYAAINCYSTTIDDSWGGAYDYSESCPFGGFSTDQYGNPFYYCMVFQGSNYVYYCKKSNSEFQDYDNDGIPDDRDPPPPSNCSAGQDPSTGCTLPDPPAICSDPRYACIWDKTNGGWYTIQRCGPDALPGFSCMMDNGGIYVPPGGSGPLGDVGYPVCPTYWHYDPVQGICVYTGGAPGMSGSGTICDRDQYGLCPSDRGECPTGQYYDSDLHQCVTVPGSTWSSTPISNNPVDQTIGSGGGGSAGGGGGGTDGTGSSGGFAEGGVSNGGPGSGGADINADDVPPTDPNNTPGQTEGADDDTPIGDETQTDASLGALVDMTRDMWNSFTKAYITDPDAYDVYFDEGVKSNQTATMGFVEGLDKTPSLTGGAPELFDTEGVNVTQYFEFGGVECPIMPVEKANASGDLLERFCPVWEETGRPVMGWFFYLLTAYAVFGVWASSSKS